MSEAKTPEKLADPSSRKPRVLHSEEVKQDFETQLAFFKMLPLDFNQRMAMAKKLKWDVPEHVLSSRLFGTREPRRHFVGEKDTRSRPQDEQPLEKKTESSCSECPDDQSPKCNES